jgi:hypothetical protein
MKLSIVNKPKKISFKLIRQAADFYAGILMSSQLRKNLSISLVFMDLDNFYATTAISDEEENYTRPREFVIEIDSSLSKRAILRGLAHELTHVKQYARGEMKDYIKMPSKVRWQDYIYEVDQDQDGDLDYWTSPWEVEAYGNEKCLYVLLQKHMKGNLR